MWLPRFACPECAAEADTDWSNGEISFGCGHRFEHRNGLYRLLTQRRLTAAEPMIRQYRFVREREGYRVSRPEYYQMLPSVPPDDPHAPEWRLRRESFERLHRRLLPAVGLAARGPLEPIRVLDVGAGNGWLSHRLASFGHQVVAVDRLDDELDGLGAWRHYATRFVPVQADFDALPFAPGQFDLVVFNGSLHYSLNVTASLARAHRMLAPGGALAVMDSPMFCREAEGHAMVADKLRRFKTDYGLTDVVHPNVGFLTFAALAETAASLGLHGRFFRSRGPLMWRARRELAWFRLRRAPAAFGVWFAR
jgi:SAM-dependent methyltransferase